MIELDLHEILITKSVKMHWMDIQTIDYLRDTLGLKNRSEAIRAILEFCIENMSELEETPDFYGENTRVVTFKLPLDLINKINELSRRTGIWFSSVVRRCITISMKHLEELESWIKDNLHRVRFPNASEEIIKMKMRIINNMLRSRTPR